MEVNMVFVLPEEFRAPGTEVDVMAAGAERAVFERPEKLGGHMKLLYIKGHLEGKPVGWMMVDGGASVNIMPLTTLQRLGHQDDELKQISMSLIGFLGEPAEARGIVSKELTIGSKTVPTAFFIVDVKGRYNQVLGRDWIHANGCVPSTLQ
jgi:hypothetical protein